jgi:hypothetical protein
MESEWVFEKGKMKELDCLYIVKITQNRSTTWSPWFSKESAEEYVKSAEKAFKKCFKEFPEL